MTRKQDAAIAALLTEPTIEAAALKAEVAYSSLRGWLRLPDFQAAYRAARRSVVEAALARLQQATGAAVDTLQRNLTCGKSGDEIKAAVAVLDHAVKAVEVLDLAERIAALEDSAKKRAKR
jgi:hypothetical protein